MHRACELKDQTYKKTRTLHFSDTSEIPPILLGIPWQQLWEALSGTTSEKRGVPSRIGGREFWKCSGSLKCLELLGLEDPSRTPEGNSRKRSESVPGVFPGFLPESPSRTGGMAHEHRFSEGRKELDTLGPAKTQRPDRPILVFFFSHFPLSFFFLFFRFAILLAFLCVFAPFPRIFKGSAERKTLAFLGGSLLGLKGHILVLERQFGRYFTRQFGRVELRVKNCRETVGAGHARKDVFFFFCLLGAFSKS